MKKLLIGLLVLAASATLLLWLAIDNPNRFKPELEALLADELGEPVAIENLSWQLSMSPSLRADGITSTDFMVDSFSINLGLSGLWTDLDDWQIKALKIEGLEQLGSEANSSIGEFALSEFKLGEPAPFNLIATYAEPGAAPMPLTASGTLTLNPEMDKLSLASTRIQSSAASGTCDVDAQRTTPTATSYQPAGPEGELLLPVETLLETDLAATCQMTHVTAGEQTFANVNLAVTNAAGTLSVEADSADFFGGQMRTEIDIDLRGEQPQWQLVPTLDQVDTQSLLTDLADKWQWVAALGVHSEVAMSGNTTAELAQSIRADSELNGGQGQLNISELKAQLLTLGALANQLEEVQSWPDVWNYQNMTGRIVTRGQQQELTLTLDNLSITAAGDVDYFADTLDLRGDVTIGAAVESSPIKVKEWLVDTPIPMRCRGVSGDPECRLDRQAAQQLVASALRGDSDTGLRRKIEEKIDESVPEEYRETARGLLDLLGRALDDD